MVLRARTEKRDLQMFAHARGAVACANLDGLPGAMPVVATAAAAASSARVAHAAAGLHRRARREHRSSAQLIPPKASLSSLRNAFATIERWISEVPS